MSEERLERIETQIGELRELMQQNMATTQQNMTVMQQNMTVMQQNMTVMQQNMTVMQQDITVMQQNMVSTQQNMNAMREDITILRQRSDSLEGTVIVAMREGFNSLRNYLDDLNYDLAAVEGKLSDGERKQRRLNRRVARLERKEQED